LLKQVIDAGSDPAWREIKEQIDYMYASLDAALLPLKGETGFDAMLRDELANGKKLLFKPNLVNAMAIDARKHDGGAGYATCTPWPFVAAVMRWLHDRLGVSYHQMAVGEAATSMSTTAGGLSAALKMNFTREAVIEGRSGDVYAGWGFYFARRYLAETHDPSHTDDPMAGYDDSVAGNYLPPGRAMDRLPVYDLNRIQDIPGSGRRVKVKDASVFPEIKLHKAVIGGNPSDPEDMRNYPGSVIINVPKLKVHQVTLLTNAFKNLGIGLYPMEAAEDDDPQSKQWLYSAPRMDLPGMKTRLPHSIWVAEADEITGFPGKVRRTGGINGVMADIVRAVQDAGVRILSVSDGIEMINLDHTFSAMARRTPEGYILASLDAVALDVVASRYMFKTIPVAEARKLIKEGKATSEYLQRVPLPTVEGPNIVTKEGIDSPISRDTAFAYAESRGTGRRACHVVGEDLWHGGRLATVEGHLGRVVDGIFDELVTRTLYYDQTKLLWDLQVTTLAWARATDQLTGSDYEREFLDEYDEDGDGVIHFEDTGKRGSSDFMAFGAAYNNHITASEVWGRLHGFFMFRTNMMRWADIKLNAERTDFLKPFQEIMAGVTAMAMSQMDVEMPDPIFPTITWGKGKWPSIQGAYYVMNGTSIFGRGFPMAMTSDSLYGVALQYAYRVHRGNGSADPALSPNPTEYVKAIEAGSKTLPFTLYVPEGFGKLMGKPVPNIEETTDPKKVLHAEFAGGVEVW
jgi:hypothetical protein